MMTTRDMVVGVGGILLIVLVVCFLWVKAWQVATPSSDGTRVLTIDYANGSQEEFILNPGHSFNFDDGDRLLGGAAPSLNFYAIVDGLSVYYRILIGPGDRYSLTTISSEEEIEP